MHKQQLSAGPALAHAEQVWGAVLAVVVCRMASSVIDFTMLCVVRCTGFSCLQAGARLAVSEMVIASTLQSGSKASRHLARFHQQEVVRSVQLYGVTPDSLDWACRCGMHAHSHLGVVVMCSWRYRRVICSSGRSVLAPVISMLTSMVMSVPQVYTC